MSSPALTALAKLQERLTEPEIRILSSADFVADFVPPDYLVDGLLQRRFIYSMTAPTGAGKTSLALLFAMHVDRGKPIGTREVQRGRSLILAGENPDDTRMRWITQADVCLYDHTSANVYFIPGRFDVDKIGPRVQEEVQKLGPVDFVIVDTSAAYYYGDDENNNVQMGKHARTLRTLTTLPGGPCVLVCCHPVKSAGPDNLLPRGGGAFVAEVDGNLTCRRREMIVDLHWQGKFRGPEFEPISFELMPITAPCLVDSKGRQLPSVMAKMLTEEGRNEIEAFARSAEDQVLLYLDVASKAHSVAEIATGLGWRAKSGEVNKSRAWRVLDGLRADKLVSLNRNRYQLTEKGKTEAKRVKDGQ